MKPKGQPQISKYVDPWFIAPTVKTILMGSLHYTMVTLNSPGPVPAGFRSQRGGVEAARKGDWPDLKVNQDGCRFIEEKLHMLYSTIAQEITWEEEGIWTWVGLAINLCGSRQSYYAIWFHGSGDLFQRVMLFKEAATVYLLILHWNHI